MEPFTDRTIDIAEPLAVILEVVYAGRPEIEQVREALVQAISCTRKEQQVLTPDHKVLKRLLELAAEEDPLVGNATELAAKCGNSDEPIDEYTIARTLRTYGFKTKSIRNPGEEPRYRYVLKRTELQEVVDRWVAESEGAPAEESEQGSEQTAAEPAQTITEGRM